MLHTHESSRSGPGRRAPAASWARCRARTWKVLGSHAVGAGSVWHLAHGSDQAHTFAAPPDVVQRAPQPRRVVSRGAWAGALLRSLRAHGQVWWPTRACTLPIAPLAYQYVPAMAMLSGHHRRVLLADEIGMGKTVQAGILLHEIHAREPDAATLVVVPASLVAQWAQELAMRVRVDAAVLDAPALRREALLPVPLVDASRAGTCWLISLDLLRQPEVARLLVRTPWTLLVVDEAHLAAPGTARHAAVSQVAAASVRLLLLTGTPHACGPGGADALRAIGARPGERPMPVVRRPATLVPRPARRTRVMRVRLREAHGALCARLDRFTERARHERGAAGMLPALVLRRRASSCPAALVRSLERRLRVLGSAPPEGPRQPRLFPGDALLPDQDAADDEVMSMAAWGDEEVERAELVRLLALARRLPPAGHKLDVVARLIRRCREPVVVFTAFVDTLRTLRRGIESRRVVVVHGEQPDALRTQAIQAFTSGEADVLLTTDASAEGLNLHARCRLVVHAELPVSARAFLQRTGRVDRYGQPRRVHAIVFASDSVEDRESLARLRQRTGDAEAWMARVATGTCRRTTLAGRVMEARAVRCRGPEASDSPPASSADAGAPPIVVCRVRHRPWRRLAERAGLSPGASMLWFGVLTCGGNTPLSTWQFPIAIAAAGWPRQAADAPAAWPEPVWRALVPSAFARARRLAGRLHAWARAADAACARALATATPAPTLFDDAAADVVGAAGADAVTGDVRAAIEIVGVLERQP